jgi:hypothetical protein
MCSDALNSKQQATHLRLMSQGGQLTPQMLRNSIPGFKAARTYLNANDGTTGLQAYARMVSGNALFDLTAESAALKTAYANVIQEGRALHNVSIGSLAVDGTVTEPLSLIAAIDCAALISACQALEAAVS